MFSTTTMASSTTNPTPTTSATSVRLLILNPSRYITPTVAMSATASTEATIAVAESCLRNIPITTTTSNTVTTNVTSTSCSEARMVRVRSLMTSSSTLAG